MRTSAMLRSFVALLLVAVSAPFLAAATSSPNSGVDVGVLQFWNASTSACQEHMLPSMSMVLPLGDCVSVPVFLQHVLVGGSFMRAFLTRNSSTQAMLFAYNNATCTTEVTDAVQFNVGRCVAFTSPQQEQQSLMFLPPTNHSADDERVFPPADFGAVTPCGSQNQDILSFTLTAGDCRPKGDGSGNLLRYYCSVGWNLETYVTQASYSSRYPTCGAGENDEVMEVSVVREGACMGGAVSGVQVSCPTVLDPVAPTLPPFLPSPEPEHESSDPLQGPSLMFTRVFCFVLFAMAGAGLWDRSDKKWYIRLLRANRDSVWSLFMLLVFVIAIQTTLLSDSAEHSDARALSFLSMAFVLADFWHSSQQMASYMSAHKDLSKWKVLILYVVAWVFPAMSILISLFPDDTLAASCMYELTTDVYVSVLAVGGREFLLWRMRRRERKQQRFGVELLHGFPDSDVPLGGHHHHHADAHGMGKASSSSRPHAASTDSEAGAIQAAEEQERKDAAWALPARHWLPLTIELLLLGAIIGLLIVSYLPVGDNMLEEEKWCNVLGFASLARAAFAATFKLWPAQLMHH